MKVLLVKILTYIQLYLVSMFVFPLHEDVDVVTSTAESEIDRTAFSKEISVPFWCTRSFDSIAGSINVTEG